MATTTSSPPAARDGGAGAQDGAGRSVQDVGQPRAARDHHGEHALHPAAHLVRGGRRRIAPRKTMETMSATPAAARNATATQRLVLRPKPVIAAPRPSPRRSP